MKHRKARVDLAGDVAYGTGEMLGWLVAHDIDPHIPVWDKAKREDGTFSRADFTYDKERALYICPGRKTMKTTGRVHDGKTLYYRASKLDCERCPLKARCCPKSPARRIPRDPNEVARDTYPRFDGDRGLCGLQRRAQEGRKRCLVRPRVFSRW